MIISLYAVLYNDWRNIDTVHLLAFGVSCTSTSFTVGGSLAGFGLDLTLEVS